MFVKKPFSRLFNQFWSYENRIFVKKIWYGYYIKNRFEREKNRELLKKIRADLRYDLKDEPLISVIIPTYNRGRILIERTVPSVLSQTYRNFELIIVGDHCTDDTERLVREIRDDRIKFFNLPERGKYPDSGWARWMVAGTVPRNKGLELASGEWIAPLDDDDEFSENHLELLLSNAVQNRYEMIYGVAQMQTESGEWVNCGSYPLMYRHICHLSVLYHSKLKFFKYDIDSWKSGEPDDWNLWRRMKESGVRIGFVNSVVGKHYRELTNWNR